MTKKKPMWEIILTLNIIIFALEIFVLNSGQVGFFTLNMNNFHIHQFLTHQFLHISGPHLFHNMLGLALFGPPIENYLGRKKFLLTYLFCGIMGSLLQISFGFTSMLLGASGSVFGIAGLYLLFRNKVVQTKLHRFLIVFSIVLIASEIFDIATGVKDNIGHWAHIGGVIGSIIIFISYKYVKRNRV